MITLTRFCYGPSGTFGRLVLPDGWSCYTVERPWLSNRPHKSCIPDGVYDLSLRRSPVVQRTSGGRFAEGWEIKHVPGRTFIMLHPANWPDDVEGCIGVGDRFQILGGRNAVANSLETFSNLMQRLGSGPWRIDIKPFIMEWP